MRNSLLVAAGIFVTYPVAAADNFPEIAQRPSYTECIDKADANDPEMASCKIEERFYWEAELNRVYKALLAERSPKLKDLQSMERLWVKEKETACASDPNGGTMERVITADCQLAYTQARLIELRYLAQSFKSR